MDEELPRSALLDDTVECITQAIDLLGSLSADEFSNPLPPAFPSPIGSHVRHNIDHFENFFAGFPAGRIDYERRARNPDLERDPELAKSAMASIAGRIATIAPGTLDSPCTVRVNADSANAEDQAQWSGSTVRRELQFLLGHAIHHHAIVASMCRILGKETCPTFGMAPSTIRHLQREQARQETVAGCAP